MNTHSIDLIRYCARSRGNSTIYLGTAGSHGNEQLQVTLGKGWEGLTVQVVFHPCKVAVQLPANGVQGGAALVLAPLFCLLIQRTGLSKRLGLAAGRGSEPRKGSGEKVSAEQEEAGPAAEDPASDRGGRREK